LKPDAGPVHQWASIEAVRCPAGRWGGAHPHHTTFGKAVK
jgi:hypothetical protein